MEWNKEEHNCTEMIMKLVEGYNEMRKKVEKIERIMKASSIPFSLPDDYYENNDYKA